jgi:DMSO/TMAO reductase YedYZ molybdopterin-dependent catalytic subunit
MANGGGALAAGMGWPGTVVSTPPYYPAIQGRCHGGTAVTLRRVFLVPQVAGAQWELGAVGNAEWTGVPLAALLERAGLDDDACEIVLEGADRGVPAEPPVPPGPASYARSLTRDKAMQREVLIAYRMNGRDLPRDHGYPVRAVVPGHYGVASVKWLTHVLAVREPFRGYWQTSDYGYWDDLDGKPVRHALVAGVAVSTDGGRTWAEAEFLDPVRRPAWRRWKLDWLTPKEPGRYTLLSRARGADGSTQPDRHDPNYGTYVITHPLPIEVFVEGTAGTPGQQEPG